MELVADMIGMKCFKGRVQGSDIDSGAIYTIVKMDDRYNKQDAQSLNWKFGHFVEEWKVPSAEFVMRMASLKPSIRNPIPVKLTIERVSNGRDTTDVIIDIAPVSGAMVDSNTGEIHNLAPARTAGVVGAPAGAGQPARKAA